MAAQITFLGVGAALPAPGQTNCSYLIELGGAVILFDCGPCVLQQLAAVGRSPGEVTHIFVSHGHGDHALGWPMLLLWWSLEARAHPGALPTLLASAPTRAHLASLWEHSYSDAPSADLPFVELPADTPGEIQVNTAITLRTWPMIHSTVFPVLGARFEAEGKAVALTADSARCPCIAELARGADLLIHDARYAVTLSPSPSIQGRFHCSAQDAGEYAAAGGAKALALVHIGAEYAGRHAELEAEAKTRFSGPVWAPMAGEVVRP